MREACRNRGRMRGESVFEHGEIQPIHTFVCGGGGLVCDGGVGDGVAAPGALVHFSAEEPDCGCCGVDDHGGVVGSGGDAVGTVAFVGNDGGRHCGGFGFGDERDAVYDEYDGRSGTVTAEVREHGCDDGLPGE